MRRTSQFSLRNEMGRDSAQMQGGARIQVVPDAFTQAQKQPLLAKLPLVGQLLLPFPPAGIGKWSINALLRFRTGAGLIQQIGDPAADRIDPHLRAFLLQSEEHTSELQSRQYL